MGYFLRQQCNLRINCLDRITIAFSCHINIYLYMLQRSDLYNLFADYIVALDIIQVKQFFIRIRQMSSFFRRKGRDRYLKNRGTTQDIYKRTDGRREMAKSLARLITYIYIYFIGTPIFPSGYYRLRVKLNTSFSDYNYYNILFILCF